MLESNVFAFEGLVNSTEIEVLFEDGFKDVFPTRLFKEVESVDKEFLSLLLLKLKYYFQKFCFNISFVEFFSINKRVHNLSDVKTTPLEFNALR